MWKIECGKLSVESWVGLSLKLSWGCPGAGFGLSCGCPALSELSGLSLSSLGLPGALCDCPALSAAFCGSPDGVLVVSLAVSLTVPWSCLCGCPALSELSGSPWGSLGAVLGFLMGLPPGLPL